MLEAQATGTHSVTDNLFAYQAVNGVLLMSDAVTLNFSDNNIQDNGTGFRNASTLAVTLQNNWWNDATGASDGVPACPTLAGGAGDSVACDSGDVVTNPAIVASNLCLP